MKKRHEKFLALLLIISLGIIPLIYFFNSRFESKEISQTLDLSLVSELKANISNTSQFNFRIELSEGVIANYNPGNVLVQYTAKSSNYSVYSNYANVYIIDKEKNWYKLPNNVQGVFLPNEEDLNPFSEFLNEEPYDLETIKNDSEISLVKKESSDAIYFDNYKIPIGFIIEGNKVNLMESNLNPTIPTKVIELKTEDEVDEVVKNIIK